MTFVDLVLVALGGLGLVWGYAFLHFYFRGARFYE